MWDDNLASTLLQCSGIEKRSSLLQTKISKWCKHQVTATGTSLYWKNGMDTFVQWKCFVDATGISRCVISFSKRKLEWPHVLLLLMKIAFFCGTTMWNWTRRSEMINKMRRRTINPIFVKMDGFDGYPHNYDCSRSRTKWWDQDGDIRKRSLDRYNCI
jgi:hypothetical protein